MWCRVPLSFLAAATLCAASLASAQIKRSALAVPLDSVPASIEPRAFSSPAALLARFRSSPKDAYETSAAFAARMAAVTDGKLYLVRIAADERVDAGECIGSIEYHADAQVFSFMLPTYQPDDGSSGAPLACDREVTGSYLALNAMGVATRVAEENRSIVEVVDGLRGADRVGTIAVPLGRARRARGHVRLALAIRLAGSGVLPLVSMRQDTTVPDLTDPRRTVRRVSAINASDVIVVVYDEASGEVLGSRALPRAAR
jgi:hypothetical protein